jgi:TPR repeat protein
LQYLEGREVPKDERRAAALWEKACTGGHAEACFNLGVLYKQGLGVAKDESRAAIRFDKACQAGISEACALR